MVSNRSALPIIQKTYDFIIWLIPKISRFPRSHKFLLGDRIQNGLLDFLGLLVEAEFSSRKLSQLRKANVEFERVRLLLRMSNDLHLLGEDGYRFTSAQVVEIGRMLGGWIKQQESLRIKRSSSKAQVHETTKTVVANAEQEISG